MPKFQLPIGTATALVLGSWIVDYFVPGAAAVIRPLNSVLLILLLGWVMHRMLRYEDRLTAHEKDILQIVTDAEARRSADLAALLQQTADLAEIIERDSKQKAELTLQVAQDLKTANAETLRQQTTELITKIEEGTAVSTAAHQEANDTNRKIENLNQRLLDIPK